MHDAAKTAIVCLHERTDLRPSIRPNITQLSVEGEFGIVCGLHHVLVVIRVVDCEDVGGVVEGRAFCSKLATGLQQCRWLQALRGRTLEEDWSSLTRFKP